jgi:hypothetical protein
MAGGALSILMAAGHTTIGTRWVLPRLADDSLPDSPFGGGAMTSAFITVTWHAVGIMLVCFGVILSVLARGSLGADGAVAVRGIGVMFAATALMVLWLARSRRRPLDLLRAPMWVLFVVMTALCWLGAAR